MALSSNINTLEGDKFELTTGDKTAVSIILHQDKDVRVSNFANTDFQDAAKSVTTAEILAAVGASNLTDRRSLIIFNNGSQTVYYGTTGVTSNNGVPIERGEVVTLLVGDTIDIFIATGAGSADVVIQEFS